MNPLPPPVPGKVADDVGWELAPAPPPTDVVAIDDLAGVRRGVLSMQSVPPLGHLKRGLLDQILGAGTVPRQKKRSTQQGRPVPHQPLGEPCLGC